MFFKMADDNPFLKMADNPFLQLVEDEDNRRRLQMLFQEEMELKEDISEENDAKESTIEEAKPPKKQRVLSPSMVSRSLETIFLISVSKSKSCLCQPFISTSDSLLQSCLLSTCVLSTMEPLSVERRVMTISGRQYVDACPV